MTEEIITALIAAVVSIAVNFALNRFKYRDLYARTVTNNRMEWINIWRKSSAELIACCEMILNNNNLLSGKNSPNNYLSELYKEFYIKKENILLRLNLDEENHKIVYAILEDLNPNNISNEKIKEIEGIVRITLKDEWERVKKEAKGKK